MRIHSDILTAHQIYQAVHNLPGVNVTVTEHGSRSRTQAFEVSLTGTSPYRTMSGEDQAATWDEWGVFFSQIFDADPNALAGSQKYATYDGEDDFHYKTADRFYNREIPSDTHPRHKWEYMAPRRFVCNKCSAGLNQD